jgi:solute carrier family 25 protein 39/40
MKQRIYQKVVNPTYAQELGISFFTGSAAGCVAAIFTHPFDVAKTVLQVSSNESSIRAVFHQLIQKEGFRGLCTGLSPRLAKVVPSCGIMISCIHV